MPVSTASTILKSSATQLGTYTALIDIVSYPDLGSAPSKLDTTTLTAQTFKTNILGLQEAPDLTFECNYDEAKYASISALAGTTYWWHLEFGVDGEDGIFEWSGEVAIFANGGAVDEVRKMTLVLSASTEITFDVTA